MSAKKAIGLVILTFLAFIQLSKQLGGDRAQVILAMYMDYNSISVIDLIATRTYLSHLSKNGMNFLCSSSWNVKLFKVLNSILKYQVRATFINAR